MKPFDHNKFLGYVSEVTPQYVKVQFPNTKLLQTFYFSGQVYFGGNVGSFVVIEGAQYGFLGRVFELNLPQGEKIEITEKRMTEEVYEFHPMAQIELLALFDVYHPETISKSVSRYPSIGAKVYSCSDEQMSNYIKRFGQKEKEKELPYAQLGKLTTNDADCKVSLNALFGRHCAVLGTTGGGKSWTVAKLLEIVSAKSSNKAILIDATGEYSTITQGVENVTIGSEDNVFSYRKLSIDELYYLLKPSSKTQVPKLKEAIRSLKMLELDKNNELTLYKDTNTDAQKQKIKYKPNLIKAERAKRAFQVFYYKHIEEIESDNCNFEITNLPQQITNECVYDTTKNTPESWGGKCEQDVSNCISLISRVNNIIHTAEYDRIFGFKQRSGCKPKDITNIIDEFLNSSLQILRFDFSNVSFDYQVREILVNAIGKYLLRKARKGDFKNTPIIVFIDEAHQFLNKSVADEYFVAKPLDAFEQISKEARKYGLFLCISTQMPRDIPLGTLSQMGTFIVHRLINDFDKKAVESAASAANRNILSFLPVLGQGEAILMGVDFPMPLILKIDEPSYKPDSRTPQLSVRNR